MKTITTTKTATTRAVLLALLSGSSFATGAQAAANLCFFPGGVQARDVPCDPTAEVSMCCGSVNACLSNGLCKLDDTTNTTGIAYARGTCSDPTWQSPVCPQNCVLNPDTRTNRTAYDFRFNGVQVWQCDGRGYGVPGKFCCESAAEKTRCCSTPAAVFGPLVPATPGNAAAVQTYDPNAGTGSSAATTRGAASATQTTTTTTTPPRATMPPTVVASKIPATPGQADASSSPTGSNGGNDGGGGGRGEGQGGIGNVAIVGMGVGASVGGGLLVALGVMWWLRRERKQQRSAAELDGASSRFSGGGGGGNSPRPDMSYGGMKVDSNNNYNNNSNNNANTYNGTGTVSSMGTSTYAVTGNPAMVRKTSSDWDRSPVIGQYQMAEIDGKETLVTPRPQARTKSMYELP
ncbi:hypothetical protein LX32DRAFT_710289 [Colletotrichum zoysiae]|uniref:Uncharacterized protein n=1 Tax=Colletotrichum zoysiae TaxID=1216348 RepID=A0AAD9LVS5_9PEZI|nr:hypothetical protein LX32DRAFT_710289 [Colletotrichum zoysiae]